jgi:transcriptional regulator with XRE-family HTH domain
VAEVDVMTYPPEQEQTTAEKFGAVLTRLAAQAGYDMTRGGTGRSEIAELTGVSVQTVGRWLKGEVLPGLPQYQRIAEAVKVEPSALLEEAGIIPRTEHPHGANQTVGCRNYPPASPEAAADFLGVTHPTIRNMLIPSMEQAQRLQRDFDLHGSGGEAAEARG